MAKKLTREQREAYRDARVTSYALKYSARVLAGMLVDLEDDHDDNPEFEYGVEWPASVAHMRPKAR